MDQLSSRLANPKFTTAIFKGHKGIGTDMDWLLGRAFIFFGNIIEPIIRCDVYQAAFFQSN